MKSKNSPYCRICMFEESVMIYIHDTVEEFQMTLSDLLKNYCGLTTIDLSDQYSKLICQDCTRELLITVKFQEKCRTSEETIGQIKHSSKDNLILDDAIEEIDEKTITESNVTENNNADDDEQIYSTDDGMIAEGSDLIKAENVDEIPLEVPYEEVEYLEQVPETESAIIHVQSSKEMSDDVETYWNDIIERTDEIEKGDNVDDIKRYIYNIKNGEKIDFFVEDSVSETIELMPDAELEYETIKYIKSPTQTIINYTCDSCGAGFFHADNLKRHVQLYHKQCEKNIQDPYETNSTVIQCNEPIEENIAGTNDLIGEPLDESSVTRKKKKKNFPCHYCTKAFVSNSLLQTHERIHTGERPFKCTVCEKTFTTQGGLDLHMRRHEGRKPFACSYCNMRFVESSNLKVHQRIHTGEKPHQCNQCKRRFSRVFLLQIHQRTHTGERPYSCPVCNKAFAQQGDLAAHKRIHTGERPHCCQVCGKGFIKSSALTTHMRRHTDHPDVILSIIAAANEKKKGLGTDSRSSAILHRKMPNNDMDVEMDPFEVEEVV